MVSGLYGLVVPIGITIVVLLIVTALLGLKSKMIPVKMRVRIHKIIAVIAITLALIHGSIVFYTNYIQ